MIKNGDKKKKHVKNRVITYGLPTKFEIFNILNTQFAINTERGDHILSLPALRLDQTYTIGDFAGIWSFTQCRHRRIRLRQQVENMQINMQDSQTQMPRKFDLQLKEKESEMDARMQIRQHEIDVCQMTDLRRLNLFQQIGKCRRQSIGNDVVAWVHFSTLSEFIPDKYE
ncbi:hypothetical protein LXL04_027543 [Taraxacum kok-saghyz]